MSITTLLFDLDDTLIDQHALLQAWAIHHPKKKPQGQLYHDFIKKNLTADLDVQALLTQLAKQYKMVLISNGSRQNQRAKLQSAQLSTYFKVITISGERAMRKPQPKIFNHCLAQINSTASESLMIGDCLTNDIAGAAHLGIQTCWLRHSNKSPHLTIQPNFIVNKITDLRSLLLT